MFVSLRSSIILSFLQDTLIGNLLRLIQTMQPSPSTSKGKKKEAFLLAALLTVDVLADAVT